MNKTLVEGKYGHGAIKLNPIHRYFRKRPILASAGEPFDWTKGYSANITIPIKDQGGSYSCGGQAGSYFLEIQRQLNGITESLSAKSVYAPIAYPGGGTTVTALETQIGAHGANLESEVPSSQLEVDMEDTTWETPQLLLGALTRAGYLPADIPRDINSIATAIRDYGAVIFEIRGQNGQIPGWTSPTPTPPSKSNPNPFWQHFICGFRAGMVNGKKTITFLNSWGSDVGVGGLQYLTEEYINSGHVIDCFTLASDRNLVPSADNQSIWANITRWFREQWGLANSLT
jgi:hypothetical protein